MIEAILILIASFFNLVKEPNVLSFTTSESPYSFYQLPTPTIPPEPTTRPSPTPTHIPTPTKKPRPTKRPTPKPTTFPTNTLHVAINDYRKQQNKPILLPNSLLCTIASERIKQLIQKGSLDHHEGIKNYQDKIFTTFTKWWEVIYYASPPQSSHTVVFDGWAKSPSHNQSLLADDATHGCGVEEHGYAVFLLGKIK